MRGFTGGRAENRYDEGAPEFWCPLEVPRLYGSYSGQVAGAGSLVKAVEAELPE